MALAETAGIMAVKRTTDMIPLCHPLKLEKIDFSFTPDTQSNSIRVTCSVSAYEKTGVEMEALMGVNIALLTLYDLIKPVCPELVMEEIFLMTKSGGKKGFWQHPKALQHESVVQTPNASLAKVSVGILTVSDRASRGEYDDQSGKALLNLLAQWGVEDIISDIVPDEMNEIEQAICQMTDNKRVDLLLMTGGTGISQRDTTPEVVQQVADKIIPGIGEKIRMVSAHYTDNAWLSRALGAVRKQTIIVTLPGSPKAIPQCLAPLQKTLQHAISIIKKESAAV